MASEVGGENSTNTQLYTCCFSCTLNELSNAIPPELGTKQMSHESSSDTNKTRLVNV